MGGRGRAWHLLGQDCTRCMSDLERCREELELLRIEKQRLRLWIHHTLVALARREAMAQEEGKAGHVMMLSRWEKVLTNLRDQVQKFQW